MCRWHATKTVIQTATVLLVVVLPTVSGSLQPLQGVRRRLESATRLLEGFWLGFGAACARGRGRTMHRALLLLRLLLAPAAVTGFVIQRVFGANSSELSHVSAGGGAHVYLTGTSIGTAFAPPIVYIGIQAQAQCIVQPFTSTNNRLHCIVFADGLPPPTPVYTASGVFESHPFRVYKADGSRLAQCWHVGGLNHGCFIQFDLGGTPRVERLLTRVVDSGGLVRVRGRGIDGGLMGNNRMLSTFYRGSTPVLGACGEKDCQASNMGSETVGCSSRLGNTEGDGTSTAQGNAIAVAYTDERSFGCRLDTLTGRTRVPRPPWLLPRGLRVVANGIPMASPLHASLPLRPRHLFSSLPPAEKKRTLPPQQPSRLLSLLLPSSKDRTPHLRLSLLFATPTLPPCSLLPAPSPSLSCLSPLASRLSPLVSCFSPASTRWPHRWLLQSLDACER